MTGDGRRWFLPPADLDKVIPDGSGGSHGATPDRDGGEPGEGSEDDEAAAELPQDLLLKDMKVYTRALLHSPPPCFTAPHRCSACSA